VRPIAEAGKLGYVLFQFAPWVHFDASGSTISLHSRRGCRLHDRRRVPSSLVAARPRGRNPEGPPRCGPGSRDRRRADGRRGHSASDDHDRAHLRVPAPRAQRWTGGCASSEARSRPFGRSTTTSTARASCGRYYRKSMRSAARPTTCSSRSTTTTAITR
jgi:hypothetical protein